MGPDGPAQMGFGGENSNAAARKQHEECLEIVHRKLQQNIPVGRVKIHMWAPPGRLESGDEGRVVLCNYWKWSHSEQIQIQDFGRLR